MLLLDLWSETCWYCSRPSFEFTYYQCLRLWCPFFPFLKSLIWWFSVCVVPLLHMHIICMSLILIVTLPSTLIAHTILPWSSAIDLTLSGSPSRSWKLLLFRLLRHMISHCCRLGCVHVPPVHSSIKAIWSTNTAVLDLFWHWFR